MDIDEMHVWFRQYAQQMGMQNTRTILPEQIDLVINTSIADTTNQLIKEHIALTNNGVVTNNSKVGQINGLKTLYKVKEVQISTTITDEIDTDPAKCFRGAFLLEKKDRNIGKMSYYSKLAIGMSGNSNIIPDNLYLLDFAISYKKAKKGLSLGNIIDDLDYEKLPSIKYAAEIENNADETKFFPVRLIDDTLLADTLNDFILKPTFKSPIIVNHNNNNFDLYIDKFIKDDNDDYVLCTGLLPWMLRVSYIAKPAKVAYNQIITGDKEDNINCDLPEYLHVDILKHAVDLWNMTIKGSVLSNNYQEPQVVTQQPNINNSNV